MSFQLYITPSPHKCLWPCKHCHLYLNMKAFSVSGCELLLFLFFSLSVLECSTYITRFLFQMPEVHVRFVLFYFFVFCTEFACFFVIFGCAFIDLYKAVKSFEYLLASVPAAMTLLPYVLINIQQIFLWKNMFILIIWTFIWLMFSDNQKPFCWSIEHLPFRKAEWYLKTNRTVMRILHLTERLHDKSMSVSVVMIVWTHAGSAGRRNTECFMYLLLCTLYHCINVNLLEFIKVGYYHKQEIIN